MTTPYIGSKISLISKLDIRYEGILFSVDPVQSTIALSQVQSFGTEDRPAPVPVPARPEIYEFIIFKASDIKDLIVCETPAKAPNMADDITYDPAIVSVSKPPEPQMQPIGEQQRQSDEKSQESPSPQQKHHPAAPPHYSPPPPPAVFAAPPPQPQSYRSAVTGGAGGGQPGGGLSGGFGQRMQRSYYNRGLGAQNQQQMPPANANYQYQQHQQQPQQNRQYFPRNQQQQHEYQYQGQNRRGGGPPNRQPQQHNYRQMQQPPQRPRFDGDFDFEKANEQFQHTIGDIGEKLAAVGLNEERKSSSVQGSNSASARESEERSVSSDKVVAAGNNKLSANAPNKKGAENFYDKTKSFFDNISCDALEREEGKDNRIDWKKERITNQETFGQTAVHSMHFRRGGRGGGGGYHRGYGGQQQYSQRPQYNNNNGNNAFARQQPPQRQANY